MAQINATEPTTIAPTPGGTFDCWWIDRIEINAADPANVFANVSMRKCFYDAAGNPNFSDAAPTTKFTIGAILQDPDLSVQNATQALIAAVTNKAQALALL